MFFLTADFFSPDKDFKRKFRDISECELSRNSLLTVDLSREAVKKLVQGFDCGIIFDVVCQRRNILLQKAALSDKLD